MGVRPEDLYYGVLLHVQCDMHRALVSLTAVEALLLIPEIIKVNDKEQMTNVKLPLFSTSKNNPRIFQDPAACLPSTNLWEVACHVDDRVQLLDLALELDVELIEINE